MKPAKILLVEDNANDVELTLAALAEHNLANEVVVLRDGAAALDFFHRRGEHAARPPGEPMLVLLDLKMPRVDGLEVLRDIKNDALLKAIPVVVLTSSREEPDLRSAYDLGVNGYVVKPVDFDKFVEVVKNLGLFWLVINEPPGERPFMTHIAEHQPLRVLLVEDNPLDAELVMQTLIDAGYECEWERVDGKRDFIDRLERGGYDLILADHNLPTFDGMTALKLARAHEVPMPFVLVSGSVGEEEAIETLRAGATDYVLKTHLPRLVPVVDRALREAAEQRRRRDAEAAQNEEAEINAALVKAASELVASLDTPVLLQRLCGLTAEKLDCDQSVALLIDEEQDAFFPASSHGRTPEQWESMRLTPLPRTAIATLLARLESEEVVELAEADETLCPAAIVGALGLADCLVAPLRRGRRIVGLLVASRHRTFSRRERRTARGIAQLASLVLANTRVVDELRHVNQLKNDFVATLSHELRTPLNVIMGYHDLLLEGAYGELTDEQKRPLARAQRSSNDLHELVRSTLDLGRLETGRSSVEIKEIAVADIVADVVDKLRPILRDKPSVSIGVDLGDDLPNLRTDSGKLSVVLRNVVHNAIKFTRDGSVSISAEVEDGGLAIVVEDTGVGIPPALLDEIFEPFRQGEDSSTRQFGGVGLGLYIARRLLQVLGGSIEVDSSPGRGSTFYIWLPREWGQQRS